MRVEREGSSIDLLPSPQTEIVVRQRPRRIKLNHAFLFELSAGFRQGSVSLTAEVNPDRDAQLFACDS